MKGIKYQGQDSPKRQLHYRASHVLQLLGKLGAVADAVSVSPEMGSLGMCPIH